jgi:hypothetical protein
LLRFGTAGGQITFIAKHQSRLLHCTNLLESSINFKIPNGTPFASIASSVRQKGEMETT